MAKNLINYNLTKNLNKFCPKNNIIQGADRTRGLRTESNGR